MKLNSKLLFIAALIMLLIPLAFTGNATAKYRGDGAVQNTTTGVWEVGDPGQCYVKDTATTGHIDATATDRTACRAIISVVANQTDCEAADGSNSLWTGRWDSTALVCTGNVVYNTDYSASPTGDREGCLHCHDGMGIGHSAVKTPYMKTGHKNMLRKVSYGSTTYIPQVGPDDMPFATDSSGNPINWSNATINVGGTDYPLVWIYEGWIGGNPRAAYLDPGANGSYTCARCHSTGFSSTTSPDAAKEPQISFPGINGTGNGQINTNPGITGYSTETYGNWDQWGIMCSRCHSSFTTPAADAYTDQTNCEGNGFVWVVPGHGSAFCSDYDHERIKWNPDYNDSPKSKNIALASTHHGGPTDGPDVVRLCGECHRQETGGLPYTWVGTNNGTAWDQGFGDHAETVIGGLSHGSPSPAVGHNYMNVFLNGAHAKFSGTYGEITDASKYQSHFMQIATYGGDNGCMGCHNVHQSLVVDGQEPFENECKDCHTGSHDKDIYKMMHPTTPGTPGGMAIADGNESEACEICHMPGALHLFRINTDVNYTIKDDFSVTGPDNTYPDGSYTQAVWNDLDMSCGQCHGGSAGPYATKNGAPYMSKAYLAAVAPNMHQDDSVPAPVTVKPAITVNISPALGKNTNFVLKKCKDDFSSCSTKEVGKAMDTYTFQARKPGAYKVRVYKKGQGYDCGAPVEDMTQTLIANGGTCDDTITTCDSDNNGDGICNLNETCVDSYTGKKKVKVTTTDVDVTVTCVPTP